MAVGSLIGYSIIEINYIDSFDGLLRGITKLILENVTDKPSELHTGVTKKDMLLSLRDYYQFLASQ